MGWIIDNKEWLFSGIGISILTLLLGLAKKESNFKVTPRFYIVLFVGGVLSFGADYLLNFDGDWRLRIFIFGGTIIATFFAERLINQVKRRLLVRYAVMNLSLEDCAYVIKCYEGNEHFVFDFTNQYDFLAKWKNILYILHGPKVVLHEPYKICANKYAYKLAKKRLERVLQ